MTFTNSWLTPEQIAERDRAEKRAQEELDRHLRKTQEEIEKIQKDLRERQEKANRDHNQAMLDLLRGRRY